MKVLELFAGSRSFGRNAQALGHTVFSVDWKPFPGIDLVTDIEFLKPEDIPFIPDFIHASPDCTTYSIAAIGHHRNGTQALSEYAKKCDRVNENFINLIMYYLRLNMKLKFTIENPVGMLRKMPFVKKLHKRTVWYCRYGDNRAKPTDFFTNNARNIFNPNGWQPLPVCWNGNPNCHHEKAPRGSGRGTEGRNDAFDRSRIPDKLCIEILNSISV